MNVCIRSIFNKRQVVAGSGKWYKSGSFKTLDYGKIDRGQGDQEGMSFRLRVEVCANWRADWAAIIEERVYGHSLPV